MRWKQFLTPVKSIGAEEAHHLIKNKSAHEVTVLDVRQPKEYEEGHIPGAKLIPIPDLNDRLDEIDPTKHIIVYCALGGRSRVAAQMLADKGFDAVFNLIGGFKGWKGESAACGEEMGMDLFSETAKPWEMLALAYSLEDGLRDFYLKMASRVSNDEAILLFQELSRIEISHQDRIFGEYGKISETPLYKDEFIKSIVSSVAEGGLTTEEYMAFYSPEPESPEHIIEMAMSIEAQALDLYMRMAHRSQSIQSRDVLLQIADEEQAHLSRLAKLIENI